MGGRQSQFCHNYNTKEVLWATTPSENRHSQGDNVESDISSVLLQHRQVRSIARNNNYPHTQTLLPVQKMRIACDESSASRRSVTEAARTDFGGHECSNLGQLQSHMTHFIEEIKLA